MVGLYLLSLDCASLVSTYTNTSYPILFCLVYLVILSIYLYHLYFTSRHHIPSFPHPFSSNFSFCRPQFEALVLEDKSLVSTSFLNQIECHSHNMIHTSVWRSSSPMVVFLLSKVHPECLAVGARRLFSPYLSPLSAAKSRRQPRAHSAPKSYIISNPPSSCGPPFRHPTAEEGTVATQPNTSMTGHKTGSARSRGNHT